MRGEIRECLYLPFMKLMKYILRRRNFSNSWNFKILTLNPLVIFSLSAMKEQCRELILGPLIIYYTPLFTIWWISMIHLLFSLPRFAPPPQIPGSKIERNRYRSGISARYIVYGAVSSSIALNADILSNTRLRGTTYHAFNTLTSYRILRAPHFRFFNPV